MGNTFEVWNWEKCCNGDDDYEWVQHYAGEDKAEAFATIETLKAKNAGCVKLEWR